VPIYRTKYKQVWVYYRDREMPDAATYAPGRRCVCTHQTVALLYVK